MSFCVLPVLQVTVVMRGALLPKSAIHDVACLFAVGRLTKVNPKVCMRSYKATTNRRRSWNQVADDLRPAAQATLSGVSPLFADPQV